MSRCGGSSPRPPPYRRTHPALACRRDGMRSRPPSPVGGAQLPSLPQQGGAPQRHHRVLSDQLGPASHSPSHFNHYPGNKNETPPGGI
jgi:hypothetical protein